MLVYLNGQFLPSEQATISVEDRGFLFGDSLYEVVRSYRGFLFEMEAHLRRLQNGLQALRIEVPEFGQLTAVASRLVQENNLTEAEATVYFQITRGAARPRKHAFPSPPVPPTVYVAINPVQPKLAWAEKGIAAITVLDVRWGRCDLKTTNLLPNVLANQQAHEAGTEEAIFVRDGMIVEGSHSNVFAIFDGVVTTHPKTPVLLPGITRQVALDLCRKMKLPHQERSFAAAEFKQAGEIFLTLTTGEITPVVSVDQNDVADGKPGAVTQRLQEAFREYVQEARAAS
jgi:D-alanine transaminase